MTGSETTRPRFALAGLSLAILLSSLGTSIANVALPTLATAFHAPFPRVQWVVLAYLLAITTLIVSVGRLGDLAGRRRLLAGGIVLFTIASAFSGAAPTLQLLIAARAAQGLGAAIMTALALAFVGETVPKEKIGSAMGLLGTMSAVGTALGPSLGGLLIAGFGWRMIFFVNVPLGVVALVLAWRTLPADQPTSTADRARFDAVGTLLLALTLGAYALAMTVGRGKFGALNGALLLAALVGVVLFAIAESKAASPLMRLAMFRNPVLSAGFAMSALVTTVVMATLVVGPFYLSRALALPAASVGLVMACGPIVSALTGVPAGRMVDRFGAHRMTVAGLVAMVSGALMLSVMPSAFGVPGYVAPLVVLTAGYALFQAANNTAVMSDLRADQRGVVSGMLNLSRNLGLITGASLMGAVFALGAATTNITAARPEAVSAGMRITFGVATGLIVIALAIASAGRMVSQRAIMRATAAGVLLVIGAMRLDAATLTLNAEARLRYDGYANARLTRGHDPQQGLFRGILGADLRFHPNVRVFAEIGSGQVDRDRDAAGANFQNDASLQQLFVDVRGNAGSLDIGAVLGRQEFADGPRQLISLGDGPNLHRTWNGARVSARGGNVRVSAFDLRATGLESGSFDERIRRAERLRGINASVNLARAEGTPVDLDPFWIHSKRPSDARETFGVRVRGRRKRLTFDWTAARQHGQSNDRAVDAWGVFAVQSVALSDQPWKPRLTAHVDVASRDFNPLYASSNYLGEGQFLSLGNLLMIAPGLAVSPTPRTNLAIEYGFARRLTERGPAYAGGMRAYAGTQNVRGHDVGGLLRVVETWTVNEHLTLSVNYEHFSAGDVLARAELPSGSYGYVAATFRQSAVLSR